MGTFIFLTTAVVETLFALFCVVTKSNQRKVRSIIRIAAFTILILLVILNIIDINLSYYALFTFLFILAIIGLIDLIRRKKEIKVYKKIHVIFKGIGFTVLIFVLTLPAIMFPKYNIVEVSGKYKVESASYTYTDLNRIETYRDSEGNRKLNVKFWYPKNTEAKYPLIIFSHGGISNKLSNESLYNELASNGYVVCSIDHTYHCLYTTDEKGHKIYIDKGYMKELFAEDAKANRQQSFVYYQKWMKIRTGDINFVIDNIQSEVKKGEGNIVYKLIDTKEIGVMGHSLGGSAALGIGRLRDDVSAVIALESPFMCDIEGVENDEFIFTDKVYPVPVLNVYSDSSWSRLSELPQYAENYALLSDINETAFNVYIRGVGHFNLTDLSLVSPILTRILNGEKSTTDTKYCLKTINKICLEFFNCYLKGVGKFKLGGTY